MRVVLLDLGFDCDEFGLQSGCSLSACLESALVGVCGVFFQRLFDEVRGGAWRMWGLWEGDDVQLGDVSKIKAIVTIFTIIFAGFLLFGRGPILACARALVAAIYISHH